MLINNPTAPLVNMNNLILAPSDLDLLLLRKGDLEPLLPATDLERLRLLALPLLLLLEVIPKDLTVDPN